MKNLNTIKCPLCGAKAHGKQKMKAFYWSCEDCAFIAFEFIADSDAEDLADALIHSENNNDYERQS